MAIHHLPRVATMILIVASTQSFAQNTCPSSSYLGTLTPTVSDPSAELIYENIAIDGTSAYLSSSYFDQGQGISFYTLHVIDIVNPQAPFIIAQPVLNAPPAAITVTNDIAYIADYQGLRIIDLSQPQQPDQLALYPTPSFAMDVQIVGTKAYIARRDDGLEIVDISNPESPTHIGEIDLPGDSRSIAVDGDLAYVADEIAFRVIDISNPTTPALMGSSFTAADAWDLSVDETGNVYLADRYSGQSVTSSVRVYDTTSPATPNQIATLSYGSFGAVRGVHAMGDQLFVVHGSSGLQSLDITNPASPQPLGEYDQAQSVNAMIDHSGLLYATSADDGLIIIDPSIDCGPCQADFNNDGVLNFFDVSAFLSGFNAQDAQADLTGDGIHNFFDVSAFLNLFNAGCP